MNKKRLLAIVLSICGAVILGGVIYYGITLNNLKKACASYYSELYELYCMPPSFYTKVGVSEEEEQEIVEKVYSFYAKYMDATTDEYLSYCNSTVDAIHARITKSTSSIISASCEVRTTAKLTKFRLDSAIYYVEVKDNVFDNNGNTLRNGTFLSCSFVSFRHAHGRWTIEDITQGAFDIIEYEDLGGAR